MLKQIISCAVIGGIFWASALIGNMTGNQLATLVVMFIGGGAAMKLDDAIDEAFDKRGSVQ